MYLLDSNVFMQANKQYYNADFCPAFWDWIDRAYAQGTVRSVEKVGQEIARQNDWLTTWASTRSVLFVPPSAETQASLPVVSQWANNGHFSQGAVNTFLAAADYYLVAHAHAYGLTVVTHETFDAQARSRIKIPNDCRALGVTYGNTYQMLRAENVRFVLDRTP